MCTSILNDCIYRSWFPGDCQKTIANIQADVDSGRVRDRVGYALYNVARAGRQAGGTDKPENFQVFILSYTTFWNDQDTACDQYSWNDWGWSTPKLTTTLRQQLNALATAVNGEIRKAANDLAGMGVFFVDGLEDAYQGHRYCEPGHSNTYQMIDYQTWYWSSYAYWQTTSEGPGDPNSPYGKYDTQDNAQTILDFVFGNGSKTVSQSSVDSPPWQWQGADKYPSFETLMAAMENDGSEVNAAVAFNLARSFHPKGTAYGTHAALLFGAIANERGGSGDDDDGPVVTDATCDVGDSGGCNDTKVFRDVEGSRHSRYDLACRTKSPG
jgi:hypothetical protein